MILCAMIYAMVGRDFAMELLRYSDWMSKVIE